MKSVTDPTAQLFKANVHPSRKEVVDEVQHRCEVDPEFAAEYKARTEYNISKLMSLLSIYGMGFDVAKDYVKQNWGTDLDFEVSGQVADSCLMMIGAGLTYEEYKNGVWGNRGNVVKESEVERMWEEFGANLEVKKEKGN